MNIKIPAAFMLLWFTISLAVVLPTVGVSSNPIIHIKPTVTQPPNGGGGGGSDIVMYALEYLVWGIIAVAIIGALIYRRRVAINALAEIASFILAFGLIGVVFLMGNRLNLTPSNNGVSGSQAGSHGAPLPGGNFAVILIFSILFGVIVAISLSRIYRTEKREITVQRSAREYVEEALYQVRIGKDVRGAILSAYKEMESLMRQHGVESKKYYTPREFERFALETLKISKKPVDTLTSLFELARYSKHEMNEEHRKEAIAALEAIRNEMEK